MPFCIPNRFKPAICRLSCVCTFLFLGLAGCEKTPAELTDVPSFHPSELLPGGNTSVTTTPFASFEKPVKNLPDQLKTPFFAGKALAEQPWIKAPTTTIARDGLGPIYNARTCMACHLNGGKGVVPEEGKELSTAFVRISVPGENTYLGVQPEPVYGDQLQTQSVSLAHQLRHTGKTGFSEHDVKPEAYVYIKWQTSTYTYPDGKTVNLRKPSLDIQNLGYGPLSENTLFSLRNAPAIHGMGLLELIPQAQIQALADEHDQNGDGISGKVNTVWDITSGAPALGRFGHKATRPNMDVVVAAAFAGDIGITNPLFPQQPCTAKQTICVGQPTGNDEHGTELPQHLLDLVVLFSRNLAVPKRDEKKLALHAKKIENGRGHFYNNGCAACHTPSFVTGPSTTSPHLANQTIWPYTDLLLHNMGVELADNRPDYQAAGDEWRTAPLWGIGYLQAVNGNSNLLHDGRARTIEEAILWHGGEAEQAKQAFTQLSAAQRNELIVFVESL